MKTTASAILAAALLSACATVSNAPPQPYRAKGESDAVMVSGTARQTSAFFVTTEIDILINGAFAAGGTIESAPATFTGNHAGKPVIADCAPSFNGYTYTYQCIVSINGERAAALTLTP